jgi:beta-glucosidase
MPLPRKYKQKKLRKAFEEGKFTEYTLDDLVYRFLRVMLLTGAFEDPNTQNQGSRNTTEHQALALRIAEEGIVLLKNQGDLLPLDFDSISTIFLTGPNLKKKFGRIFSGGSSAVVAPYEITPLKGIEEKLKGKAKIVTNASNADVAIVFAGLNHSKGMDSESYDRPDLQLPEKQIELINETAKDNPNTIVVLIAGSPIAMDKWIDNVPVVLDAWYPGMEGGRAIANVLFGDTFPSGKLPITFPQKLKDSPAHHSGLARNYPGDEVKDVHYDEGIYVGYRWFDKKEISPLFPFGFGLGYTTFGFEDASVLSKTDDSLSIQLEIENIGEIPGGEVVQVYSHDVQSSLERPPKELVGFEKVVLTPGERKAVTVKINSQDMMFYDIERHDWILESGEFELQIGNSSRNILSKVMIEF